MRLFYYIFFIANICLFSCNEKQVQNSESVIDLTQNDSAISQINDIDEQIPIQINTILAKFPILKQTNNFSYYDELPDSLYQLKDNEINKLKLNDKYSKESQQYINWYVYGKTEKKDYFSLFLFQTLESVCLYQANYSKKDSSLIQLFLLSEWSNPCEETSSTETRKVENKYIQKTKNEYEEWEENGKDGKSIVEIITTNFLLNEKGKIDSLTSSKKVITKKLK